MRWASLRNSSATSVDGVRVDRAGMGRPFLAERRVFSVGVRSVMLVDWRGVACVLERVGRDGEGEGVQLETPRGGSPVNSRHTSLPLAKRD